MANTIQIRRSATQGAVPTTTQLALGELAINTYDGKLFLKKDDGTESIVDITAGGGNVDLSAYATKASPTITGTASFENITSTGQVDFSSTNGIYYTILTAAQLNNGFRFTVSNPSGGSTVLNISRKYNTSLTTLLELTDQGVLRPAASGQVDIGTSSQQFRDLYISGSVYSGGVAIGGATNLDYNALTRTIECSTGTDATLPEVTAGGVSGLMTGTDKTKLDGIATGADVTPAFATQAEAEAGTNNTTLMTPLRTAQAITALGGGGGGGGGGVSDSTAIAYAIALS